MTAGRKAFVLILAIGLLTTGAGGETRHDADVLVALGAGVAGTWETEFDFANNASLPLAVFAGEQPNEFVCVTSPCGIAYAMLPRTGAARIVATPADFGRFTGRLFVGAHDAEELPAVRARVVNRARPSQAIELPLFRRSTLVALDPRVLAYPSAVRTAGHSTPSFVTVPVMIIALSAFSAVPAAGGSGAGGVAVQATKRMVTSALRMTKAMRVGCPPCYGHSSPSSPPFSSPKSATRPSSPRFSSPPKPKFRSG